MSNAITIKNQSLDVLTLGDVLTKSGYFQDANEAAKAIVKVLAGQELGLGPIAAMTGIYIIKGKITLSANAMAAIVKNSGKYDYLVTELDAKHCKIEFYQGDNKIGLSEFNMEDAKQAGLVKDNWQKFPRNMLFARAMSNGAKWFCADVFAGTPVYTPDELGVDVDGETGQIIEGETISIPNQELKQKTDQELEQRIISLANEELLPGQIIEKLEKEHEDAKARGISVLPFSLKMGDVLDILSPKNK